MGVAVNPNSCLRKSAWVGGCVHLNGLDASRGGNGKLERGCVERAGDGGRGQGRGAERLRVDGKSVDDEADEGWSGEHEGERAGVERLLESVYLCACA